MTFKLAPEGFNLRELDVWGALYEARELGSVVEAKVSRLRHIEGQGETWELEFPDSPGVTGLVPAAESGLPPRCPMTAFVGKLVGVKIKSIDKKNSMVACSRREAVEMSLGRLMGQLEEGEIINSLIRIVTEYNTFLDLGGGVIINIPREKARLSAGVPLDVQHQVGVVMKVKVTKLNKDLREIQIEPVDPWEVWEFKRGEIILGKVAAVRGLMVYATVKPGLIGLISCKPNEYFAEGKQLELQVISFDRAQRKLHLTVWNPRRAAERKREKSRNKRRQLVAR
ncbi:RNA binding S1 domain protein [Desulfofarcimen acetoxidans DSM 771]|uniref:RNA binding S1 domain protein n=1 Tax=Desulfofarcimen acetoxidans (strain ATCC 49208 / DSM 771 / KCTC 5769 / VKM B-1644 / 5575) TaxID=485916 RepID=C8W6J2_DESAS|nr:RNA-binding protein S1 [Desulfofarcimen acetoxidans]ACV62281.1 RNA binding S1 domain protein [Desulfofarcimen acetoxidans DSM 771]